MHKDYLVYCSVCNKFKDKSAFPKWEFVCFDCKGKDGDENVPLIEAK